MFLSSLNHFMHYIQELSLLDPDANVFKKVGPVLMKVDYDDALQTVQKRLEFISGEV